MLWAAVIFEGGLLVLAFGLGALLDAPPFARLAWRWQTLVWGLLATAPALLALWWGVRSGWPAVRRAVRELDRALEVILPRASLGGLATIALLAGVAEEALFRGVIQTALVAPIGAAAAVVVASALFAAAHPVSLFYAAFAGAMGLYLGWLMLVSGDVLVPIIVHTVYDFVGLVYFVRVRAARRALTDAGG